MTTPRTGDASSGSIGARAKYFKEFIKKMYPAFSRRATQVCVLSTAMEKIALGAPDHTALAHAALKEADAFGWNERAPTAQLPAVEPCKHPRPMWAGDTTSGPNFWCRLCGAWQGLSGEWILPRGQK